MTPPEGGDGVVGDGGDWGAGAVGNSLWTGVPLRDVLKRAGVTRETPTRRHVHLYGLESVDDDGAGREYGVSIPLRKALDPAQDVLVAYAQNGETLTPDHGYPVRAIVPGDVGGNSIKWLSRVEVRETPLLIESAHARTRDNVFPPHVTTEKIADKERWWTNPDVAMRELCVNAVVCAPRARRLRQNYAARGERAVRDQRVRAQRRRASGDARGGEPRRRRHMAMRARDVPVPEDGARKTVVLGDVVDRRRARGAREMPRNHRASVGRSTQHAAARCNLEPPRVREQRALPREDGGRGD